MAARRLIEVCPSAALRDGAPGVRFEVASAGERASGFVVRFRGRAFGFLNRCAHMPMELDWVAGQFFDADGERLVCATHGAEYEPDSGRCAGGPCAGRGLRRLIVLEADGRIWWQPEPEHALDAHATNDQENG